MITKTRKLKPCPFAILADNREWYPYHFDRLAGVFGYSEVRVERCYLPTGDYSIAFSSLQFGLDRWSMEGRFAIERKSLEDLYGTLGQNRQRFEAEVQRMNELDFAAIVIEAETRELWRPAEFRSQWRSRLWPKAVEGTLVSWSIRYPRVHWWTVGSRAAGEVRVFGACKKFWKQAAGVKSTEASDDARAKRACLRA